MVGLVSRCSTHRATELSTRVAVVLATASVVPPSARTTEKARKVAVAATTPAGTAKRRTRPTKPASALGAPVASARTKPGMPMVRLLTSVNCRGRNGNGQPATPTARASATA